MTVTLVIHCFELVMPHEATAYYLTKLVMSFDTAVTIVSHSSKQVMTNDTSMTIAVCPGLVFIEKLQKDDLMMTYFAV